MNFKYTVLKFSAPWCGQCNVLNDLIKKNQDIFNEVGFKEIDVEEDEDMVTKYNIRNLPTLVIIDNETQEEIVRNVGMMSLDNLKSFIKTYTY